MDRAKLIETVTNLANTVIILMIVLLYVMTGTSIGDDAIAALPNMTAYRGKQKGAVAIECVVTWNAEALPDMLATLDKSGQKITFFVSGKWAKNNGKALSRIAESGHEVGTAGYAPLLDANSDLLLDDVEMSVAIIKQITGENPARYYSGLRNQTASLRAASALGLSHIACSVDLLCGRGTAEEIVLRASEGLFDGSILLIQPTAAAAKALPKILELIRQQGYGIVTVDEILQMRDIS